MIRLVRLSKRLAGKLVLKAIDLEVRDGETLVIVGSSGSGKSVTLKHMVRLLTPDSGEVWVGDELISEARGRRLAALRGRFGVVFQGAALLEWLTVRENVALPLQEKTRMSPGEIQRLVEEKLEMVGLSEDLGKYPSELSGGMRKRAGLARAIVTNPEIVLYDEPTSGLDPVSARTIDRLIHRLCRELGVTSVVVTHDLAGALAIGTRIAMLHGGRIVEAAEPAEFVRSENPEVLKFLEAQFITEQGDRQQAGVDTGKGEQR